MLFIDFESGGIVQVAATAETVWDGPEVVRFAGAERMLRFHVEERVTAERASPLRWRFRDYSPFLASLGSWTVAPGKA